MLRDLIKPPKKTEPTSVSRLRRGTIVTLLLLLVSIFALLSVKMVSEPPVLSTTIAQKDNPLAPAVHLGFERNFNISCTLYYDANGSRIDSCDQYIIQPKITDDVNFPFIGSFSPNGNVSLSKVDNGGPPRFIFLYMNVFDPVTVFNDSSQASTFRLTAYDSENELDDIQSRQSSDPFISSLFTMNKYALSKGYIYRLDSSRRIRNSLPRTFLSYTGFPVSYDIRHYIESKIEAVPMNTPIISYVTVIIGPRDFIEVVEQEQRSITIITILGAIAAYYGCIVVIYVFLFGVDSVRPWGVIHNGCCGLGRKTKERLTKRVNLPDTSNDLESLSQKISELEGFRRFLEGNVIDTTLLEAIRNRKHLDDELSIKT